MCRSCYYERIKQAATLRITSPPHLILILTFRGQNSNIDILVLWHCSVPFLFIWTTQWYPLLMATPVLCFIFELFFFFFLRLSFRLYSLWVQCTRCSFGCNIRLFLASVYQYTALVCSLFCPLCIEQYQSVWACVWVSECVCVSPLQERSQILLQFSHFSIYLQWLSLCNSECIFVHWIWIYIYIYDYICMKHENGLGLLFWQHLLLLKWYEFVL